MSHLVYAYLLQDVSVSSILQVMKQTEPTRLNATDARETFSDLITRAAFRGERFVVTRYGRDLVQIAPAEELAKDKEKYTNE